MRRDSAPGRLGLRRQCGITLLELLIAASILALILVVTERAISTADRVGELNQKHAEKLRRIDRAWVLLENDLRNALAVGRTQDFDPLPALRLDPGEPILLMLLRGGQSNPLLLPRMEMLRVGYRYEEEVLSRLSWVDPFNPEEELAREQVLLEDVQDITIRVLPGPPVGRSIEQGPWYEDWPKNNAASADLPLALEITLTLTRMGEISRFITLARGE